MIEIAKPEKKGKIIITGSRKPPMFCETDACVIRQFREMADEKIRKDKEAEEKRLSEA